MANRDTILAYWNDIEALIFRLVDGDPALIVPALAAAATLLTIIGAVGLLAGRDPIAARLDTGVSGADRRGRRVR